MVSLSRVVLMLLCLVVAGSMFMWSSLLMAYIYAPINRDQRAGSNTLSPGLRAGGLAPEAPPAGTAFRRCAAYPEAVQILYVNVTIVSPGAPSRAPAIIADPMVAARKTGWRLRSDTRRMMELKVTVRGLEMVYNLDLEVTPLVLGVPAVGGPGAKQRFRVVPSKLQPALARHEEATFVLRVPHPVFELPFGRLSKDSRVARLSPFIYRGDRFFFPSATQGGTNNEADRNTVIRFAGTVALTLPQPLAYVELGTGHGAMLAYVAQLVRGLSPRSKVVSVELVPSRQEGIKTAMESLGYNDTVLYHTGDATHMNWTHGPVGFIFADINVWHMTASALMTLTPHLVVGGFIVFHDTYYSLPFPEQYLDGIKRMIASEQFQIVQAADSFVLQKISGGAHDADAFQTTRLVARPNEATRASVGGLVNKMSGIGPMYATYDAVDCIEFPTFKPTSSSHDEHQ